jgi:hypothetical protein
VTAPNAITLTAVVAVLLAPHAVRAQPAKFTLEISPTEGTVDDTYVATVQIEIKGVSGPERYSHPELPEFEVVDSRANQTTSMLFDPQRGQELRTIEVKRYVLKPKLAGRLSVGPAKLRIHGQEYETRRLVVRVRSAGDPAVPPTLAEAEAALVAPGSAAATAPPRPPPDQRDLFLHVVADATDVFVGQQVTVTWLLYTRSDVLGFEPKPPSMDDLWWENLYEPKRRLRYEDVSIDGVPYLVTVVSKRAVFPNAPGVVEIPPYRAQVSTIWTPSQGGAELASAALSIRARAQPEAGRPDDFDSSYVGVFSLDAAVDRHHVEAGESVTLTVTVRGQGAVRRTNPPAVAVEGFRVDGPREDDPFVDVSDDVVRGERVYRYWLIPEREGALTIPALEIAYFDPGTARYHRARSAAIEVEVAGNRSAGDAISSVGSLRANVIARDVRPLGSASSIDARVAPYLYTTPWFWLLALAPPGVFALIWIGDRLRERLRRETPRSRLRKARGRARRRFRVAEIHIRGNRPVAFYGELSRALYEHIEDRLGEPVSSMTREQMRAVLLDKGFAGVTVDRIGTELETCDFARFAPSASGPGEMRAALRRVRELLREIERVRPDHGAEVAA